jgi:hypothetical protein
VILAHFFFFELYTLNLYLGHFGPLSYWSVKYWYRKVIVSKKGTSQPVAHNLVTAKK